MRSTTGCRSIDRGDYAVHLRHEYLRRYVARGGSAVKVVALDVPHGPVRGDVVRTLEPQRDGFLTVAVDSAETRVHLLDELFEAISRQIPWLETAQHVVRSAYRHAAVDLPASDGSLAVRDVAEANGVDATELYRSVRRHLERTVLASQVLAPDFRVAMLRIAQSILAWGDVDSTDHRTVTRWLRGQSVTPSDLRSVGLSRRINRQAARQLLISTAHWLRLAGWSGLVVELCLCRLGVVRRPAPADRRGFYYGRAAVLDVYESLRQFIDGCDDIDGLLLLAVLPPRLVTDERRGIRAYRALHLRLVEEIVDDGPEANPFAPMVGLRSQGGTT